jgi:hypothetical protein
MATTLGAIALTGYAATGALDTINEDTGEKTSGTQGAGILAAGGIVYSYIDGVISTNKLNKQKVWALGEPERRRQQEEARIEQERQQIEQERQQEEARIEQERRQEEAKFAFTSFVDVYTKKAIQAGSPILIVNQKTEPPDFLNSVDCRIEFINISKKRIKYVDFTAVPYNRVDDIAYSESRKTMRVTDFIQPSEYYSAYWENIWFNSTITYMKIIGIEVTYDDNTTQAINNSKIIENSSLSSDEYTEYKRLEIHADGRILTGRVGSIL